MSINLEKEFFNISPRKAQNGGSLKGRLNTHTTFPVISLMKIKYMSMKIRWCKMLDKNNCNKNTKQLQKSCSAINFS